MIFFLVDKNECVIKAMVLTGGRGLGHFNNGFKGGVHMCKNGQDVSTFASKMLGANLITKQTTKEGLPCSKVMLVEKVSMKREMYISIVFRTSWHTFLVYDTI
jgi:succinyl-CoA synthetase beta subunit